MTHFNAVEGFLSIWTIDYHIENDRPFFGRVERDRLFCCLESAKSELGARLSMLTARDYGRMNDRFSLLVILDIPATTSYLAIETPLPDDNLTYRSLTPLFPNASWPEREIRDMFGITACDTPDTRPFIRKGAWPADLFPLRKDISPHRAYPIERVLLPTTVVEGEGVIEVPVGPIHAGIIEPGHFRIQVIGDTLLSLDAQFAFCHRGIEKLAEGRDPLGALLLAERQCGTCSVSNTLSFCLAVENAAGISVPPRAAYIRVILAELERLYNHVNDIAAIAAGIGMAFVTQQGLVLKEELQRINAGFFGHRFLRNVVIPGGIRSYPGIDPLNEMVELLAPIVRRLDSIVAVAIGNSIFQDRLENTGILTRSNANELGGVGPAARASGVSIDTRCDHPYDGYRILPGFDIPTRHECDVMARFRMRLDEIPTTLALIEAAVKSLPVVSSPIAATIPIIAPGSWGFGATESARGENCVFIAFDAHGRIDRYAVRTASYLNWPLIPTTVRGNILPDFPLINKSFELCYADVDR
ncbi:MAG: NADH-quinone oxidoreductase subunit C [Candidatus Riflebacteria bacterium]|nr:NADH-quinone oxidoreductase subunit C [Candidatus Riflebacteria bacterium]